MFISLANKIVVV